MLKDLMVSTCGLLAIGDVASSHVVRNKRSFGSVLSIPRERRTAVSHSADLCRSVSERAYDPLI
ncbi:hypothetical protein GCM10027563_17160 [Parasphingorhabdus pacifica]